MSCAVDSTKLGNTAPAAAIAASEATKTSNNNNIRNIALIALTALAAAAATACYVMAMPFVATVSTAALAGGFAIATLASFLIKRKSVEQQAPATLDAGITRPENKPADA